MAKNLVNGERLRLVIDHISKHYKDLAETEMVALRNVDIIVDNEEWVAMLGPSGTGKYCASTIDVKVDISYNEMI